MSLERYHEARACGLDRRTASYIGAAAELATIFREARERQEAFMAEIGYSLAELRQWPEADRPFLNDLFAAWRAERGMS